MSRFLRFFFLSSLFSHSLVSCMSRKLSPSTASGVSELMARLQYEMRWIQRNILNMITTTHLHTTTIIRTGVVVVVVVAGTSVVENVLHRFLFRSLFGCDRFVFCRWNTDKSIICDLLLSQRSLSTRVENTRIVLSRLDYIYYFTTIRILNIIFVAGAAVVNLLQQ